MREHSSPKRRKMSFRVLAGRVGLAGKAAARRQRGSLIADGAFASHRPQVATALTPTDRSTRTGMNHQVGSWELEDYLSMLESRRE